MKILTLLLMFTFITGSSLSYGCCASKPKKKFPEKNLPQQSATNPLEDYETFKAAKIVISLMQKNLTETGRKKGIDVAFAHESTDQGLVAYYYGYVHGFETPQILFTPWGKFFQDHFEENIKTNRLFKKELPDWKQGAGGDYYAITQADSIKLPAPSRNSAFFRTASNENEKMCQDAWIKLEARFDAEKKQDTKSKEQE